MSARPRRIVPSYVGLTDKMCWFIRGFRKYDQAIARPDLDPEKGGGNSGSWEWLWYEESPSLHSPYNEAPRAMRAIGGTPFLRPKETLVGHQGPVWGLAIGENHLYSGSSDKTLKVPPTSSTTCTLDAHKYRNCSYSPTLDMGSDITKTQNAHRSYRYYSLSCSHSWWENGACCSVHYRWVCTHMTGDQWVWWQNHQILECRRS